MRSVRVLGQVAWDRRRKPSKERTDGYEVRDASLRELGYKNYSEYLRSPEWKVLRADVLSHRSICVVCDGSATQIHHYSYDMAVLLGIIPELLIPLCRYCHEDIEINEEGNKRLLEESQKRIHDMLKVVGKFRRSNRIHDLHQKSGNISAVEPRKTTEKKKRRNKIQPK